MLGTAAGIVALVYWAATTELDAVTRSNGVVVPSIQNQVVQHLEGGIVSEILVKDGDKVEAGQVLLKIRDTEAASLLAQARSELAARRAELARLDAEIGGADQIAFPDDLGADPVKANELDLFLKRKLSLEEQTAIADDQMRQQELALAELTSRLTNLERERALLAERTESLDRLNKLGAVSKNELLSALGNLQQLDTKLSDLSHQIPQTEAALSEATRRRNETVLSFRAEASQQRSKTLLAIAQLEQGIGSLGDRATRSEVRAPVAGVVNKLLVSTVGGVVAPGAPLAEIVPATSSIGIEAKLSPQDRADVWPGTPAIVKVTAYDYSIYGGLKARIVEISPDVIEEKEGEPYFRVRLSADASDLGPKNPVVPGMIANVDMLTQRHTILEYLLTPLTHLRDNALRE
nr:HlyD family type I secretion periplasmic adaptor subunit [Chthonobacter albigriseus]